MNHKYYTPTIEEFYYGFEFEYLPARYNWLLESSGQEWIKEHFYASCGQDGESEIYEIERGITQNKVRVKHLDDYDIHHALDEVSKSSEVKYERGRQGVPLPTGIGWTEWRVVKGGRCWGVVFANTAHNLMIEEFNFGGELGRNAMVFNASCKNKSEFKKILKQVGIL